MTTQEELLSQFKQTELEINSFETTPPSLQQTNSNPITFVLPDEEKERLRKELADFTAGKLSPLIFNFVVDKATEVATKIANDAVAPVIDRLNSTISRLDALETRVSNLENI